MNVIITGASRGIGHAVAQAFLSVPGHMVGITARSAAPLEQLAAEAVSGSRAIPYPFDLAGGKIGDLTETIARDFDKVDILINNAGYLVNKPFTALGREDYLKSLEINFLAPVFLIRGLLPLLERSEVSHVVNISSMGGFQGITKIAGLAAYSASKAALNNLSELLATELAEKGIRVNALAPGTVDTKMLRLAIPGYKAPVTPDEMAEFIYTFATTAWKVINGKVIPVALTTV
jgi:NAD(P)-dependent dehydrogenase (short-subunit alcohol dehydrogenase family)